MNPFFSRQVSFHHPMKGAEYAVDHVPRDDLAELNRIVVLEPLRTVLLTDLLAHDATSALLITERGGKMRVDCTGADYPLLTKFYAGNNIRLINVEALLASPILESIEAIVDLGDSDLTIPDNPTLQTGKLDIRRGRCVDAKRCRIYISSKTRLLFFAESECKELGMPSARVVELARKRKRCYAAHIIGDGSGGYRDGRQMIAAKMHANWSEFERAEHQLAEEIQRKHKPAC